LSRLYETVQTAVGREVGIRANVLTIAKEAQKRGAVHFHYALGVESALELRAAKAFRRHLERLSQAPRYGFGHVNGKFVRPRPAREAAAYLSSYFLGGRGQKAKLTEAVQNPELPRLPLYVSRRLTSVTKTTMRNKRRQRHLWVSRARGGALPAWWSDHEARVDVLLLGVHVETRLQHATKLRAILGAIPVAPRRHRGYSACGQPVAMRFRPPSRRPVTDPVPLTDRVRLSEIGNRASGRGPQGRRLDLV